MLGFMIQRLLQALVVMLVISALVFIGVYAVGNPIDVLISPDATQAIRESAIKAYGLDQPLWKQYLDFLGRLAAGDFGRSFLYNMPVLDLIASRIPRDAGTDAGGRARRHVAGRAAWYVCRLPAGQRALPHHHDRVDLRVFGADLLDRAGC